MKMILIGGVLTSVALTAGQDYRTYVGQEKRFCGLVVSVEKSGEKCGAALLIGSYADNWKIAAVHRRVRVHPQVAAPASTPKHPAAPRSTP